MNGIEKALTNWIDRSSHPHPESKMSRRDFLRLTALEAAGLVVAACSPTPISPDTNQTPKFTIVPDRNVPESTKINLVAGLNAQIYAGNKPDKINQKWLDDNGWIVYDNPPSDNKAFYVYAILGDVNNTRYTIDVKTGKNNKCATNEFKVVVYANKANAWESNFDSTQQVTVLYEQKNTSTNKSIALAPTFVLFNEKLYVKPLTGTLKRIDFNSKSLPKPEIYPPPVNSVQT